MFSSRSRVRAARWQAGTSPKTSWGRGHQTLSASALGSASEPSRPAGRSLRLHLLGRPLLAVAGTAPGSDWAAAARGGRMGAGRFGAAARAPGSPVHHARRARASFLLSAPLRFSPGPLTRAPVTNGPQSSSGAYGWCLLRGGQTPSPMLSWTLFFLKTHSLRASPLPLVDKDWAPLPRPRAPLLLCPHRTQGGLCSARWSDREAAATGRGRPAQEPAFPKAVSVSGTAHMCTYFIKIHFKNV